MTLMTSAFCLYISLSGAISGSADALAVKTTKSVIASAFPIVGGILSDSAAAMLSAAGLIKNSAGVFCLIAVCALCAGPFALLSVKMLVFKLSSAGTIAGSYVQSGKIARNCKIRVVRDGIVIAEDAIASLKRMKDDVKEVASGYECGIGLEKYNDIKEGDILEAYQVEEYRED